MKIFRLFWLLPFACALALAVVRPAFAAGPPIKKCFPYCCANGCEWGPNRGDNSVAMTVDGAAFYVGGWSIADWRSFNL